jgi:hypothetical protein
VHCGVIAKAGNTNWGGRFSTIDLLIKVSRFVSMVNNIFHVKRNWSKLASTRRSSVLSLPLQLEFPGQGYRTVWEEHFSFSFSLLEKESLYCCQHIFRVFNFVANNSFGYPYVYLTTRNFIFMITWHCNSVTVL